MNKNKLFGIFVAATLGISALLTGCGNSSSTKSAGDSYYATEAAMEEPAAAYEEMADYDTASAGNVTEGSVQDTSRKLITTLNLSAETEDFEKSKALVENKVGELGGYVENSSINNNDKSANYTIRIPAQNLDGFISYIEGSSNIINKSVNVQDVTLDYADVESRKKALRTEEERLLAILENAETVEDLITVESRLSDVRYEIESIESQLRTYDNKINYATVYLYIEEVEKFTPVEEQSAGKRMADGFVNSLVSVKNGLVEFFIFIVVHIPQLIIMGIIVAAIVLIVKKVSKRSDKAKAPVNTESTKGKNE